MSNSLYVCIAVLSAIILPYFWKKASDTKSRWEEKMVDVGDTVEYPPRILSSGLPVYITPNSLLCSYS